MNKRYHVDVGSQTIFIIVVLIIPILMMYVTFNLGWGVMLGFFVWFISGFMMYFPFSSIKQGGNGASIGFMMVLSTIILAWIISIGIYNGKDYFNSIIISMTMCEIAWGFVAIHFIRKWSKVWNEYPDNEENDSSYSATAI